jgi:hypothetical protein
MGSEVMRGSFVGSNSAKYSNASLNSKPQKMNAVGMGPLMSLKGVQERRGA